MMIIRNVSKSAYRMNFDGSCDTKDWRNDAKNVSFATTAVNYILKL